MSETARTRERRVAIVAGIITPLMLLDAAVVLWAFDLSFVLRILVGLLALVPFAVFLTATLRICRSPGK